MKGSPSLSPPPEKGRGTGGGFPNTSMVFGEGESFFKRFNGFRGRGEQNESMFFQCFPRLTPVAPVSFFFSILQAKVNFD